jgi:hypothetical protein
MIEHSRQQEAGSDVVERGLFLIAAIISCFFSEYWRSID